MLFEKTNQRKNAEIIYEEGISNNPQDFILRNNFGKFLNVDKNYNQSLIHLTKAFKINPNSSKLNFNIAMAYKGLGQFEKAIHHYKKTLELKPDYFQAYSHLSSLYYDKNLYFEAIEFIKKAIEINPSYAEGLNNLVLY